MLLPTRTADLHVEIPIVHEFRVFMRNNGICTVRNGSPGHDSRGLACSDTLRRDATRGYLFDYLSSLATSAARRA